MMKWQERTTIVRTRYEAAKRVYEHTYFESEDIGDWLLIGFMEEDEQRGVEEDRNRILKDLSRYRIKIGKTGKTMDNAVFNDILSIVGGHTDTLEEFKDEKKT